MALCRSRYVPVDTQSQDRKLQPSHQGSSWLISAGCKLVLTARRTDRLEKLAKDLHDKYKVRTAFENSPCNPSQDSF